MGPFSALEAVVRAFAVEHPDVVVDVSMRRNFRAALDALRRDEVDIAFGNVATSPETCQKACRARLRCSAWQQHRSTSGAHSPRPTGRTRGAAASRAGVPAQKSRDEFSRFVAEYAKSIDAPTSPLTMGSAMDGVVDRVAADPATVTLVTANFNVPEATVFGCFRSDQFRCSPGTPCGGATLRRRLSPSCFVPSGNSARRIGTATSTAYQPVRRASTQVGLLKNRRKHR